VYNCKNRNYINSFEKKLKLVERLFGRNIVLSASVLNAGGAYAQPVTRLSFQHARQRFLGLIGQNPPQHQQCPDDDDVDMLVPNGLLAFF